MEKTIVSHCKTIYNPQIGRGFFAYKIEDNPVRLVNISNLGSIDAKIESIKYCAKKSLELYPDAKKIIIHSDCEYEVDLDPIFELRLANDETENIIN